MSYYRERSARDPEWREQAIRASGERYRKVASLAARRGVDPVQAARMTGDTLGTWTRFYASDYGKAQRDEARARMLEAGFGAVEERPAR